MAATVPDFILQTAWQKIARLQAREFDALRDVHAYFDRLIPDFRRDLENYFLQHFVLGVVRPKPTFLDTPGLDELTTSFDTIVDAVEDNIEEDLDERLADEYDESYWFALWELRTWGIDVEEAPPPPDRKGILALILAAGIAGLNHRDRLRTWGQTYRQKFREWVSSSARIGRDYDDIMSGVDRVFDAWRGRVTALAGDELHRAHLGGTRAAWGVVPNAIVGEVWLTREDPLVCPLCREKHLSITNDQPIEDSHPACRCIKVPILLTATGVPVDYLAFLRSIGKR